MENRSPSAFRDYVMLAFKHKSRGYINLCDSHAEATSETYMEVLND